MNSPSLIIFFTAHIIGDYYLQNNRLAKSKEKNIKHLVVHGILYSIPYLILFLLSAKSVLFFYACLTAIILHFVIDLLKYFFCKLYLTKKRHSSIQVIKCFLYLFDQGLHILTILLIIFFWGSTLKPINGLRDFLKFFHFDTIDTIKWILLVLLMYKPVNITFNKIFSSYKPLPMDSDILSNENCVLLASSIDKDKKKTDVIYHTNSNNRKAGAVIGFLERILILILINIGQFSAIGLVLTAKSIARYEMISKDQEFGEYYLIGTFTSVLSAILAYYLVI